MLEFFRVADILGLCCRMPQAVQNHIYLKKYIRR
jgi:hypothetical protein